MRRRAPRMYALSLPAGAVRLRCVVRHALNPASRTSNQLQCTRTSAHTTHGPDIEAEAMDEGHISASCMPRPTRAVRGIVLWSGSVLVTPMYLFRPDMDMPRRRGTACCAAESGVYNAMDDIGESIARDVPAL
ncbi:hypothetical protein B0H19DRAFT_594084 [Mycena capillaripes]|nr:hypothetical protein B0H19DRAFT_594084 [Mycena capillaripes]